MFHASVEPFSVFELMAKHAKMMKTKQRKKILLTQFCSARSCGFFGTLIKTLAFFFVAAKTQT
jgi:hypothetical protein